MRLEDHGPEFGANLGRYLWTTTPGPNRRNIHQADGRLNHRGFPRLLGSCPNVVLKHYESSDHLWDAPADATLCRSCFSGSSKAYEPAMGLLDEVRLLRSVAKMLYGAHSQVAMDTERDEALRMRVLARALSACPWLESGYGVGGGR